MVHMVTEVKIYVTGK